MVIPIVSPRATACEARDSGQLLRKPREPRDKPNLNSHPKNFKSKRHNFWFLGPVRIPLSRPYPAQSL